jgi:hypothetical protein
MQHFAYDKMIFLEGNHDEMIGNPDGGGRSGGRGGLARVLC